MTIRSIEPKNFPFTICQRLKGFVSNSSSVPCFFSSEKLRIVTAGIRNRRIQGDKLKNGLKSAKPLSKILNSPSKTQRNNPFIIRKMAITKYPIGDPKKDFISRNTIDFILSLRGTKQSHSSYFNCFFLPLRR
jgi:hypothetical protein